ncbi:hypothetical protein [Emcibacter sp. SYSU 3D8]|uniref:hypothetical protein n=1 Tax=Emcibacter sp. SYSU 3D8 TaxID=3133969 RepID=UPI0031FE9E9C
MKAYGMFRIIAAAAVLLIATSWSGHADAAFGRTKPILNIVDEPVATGSGDRPNLMEVERAIRAGAVQKGWLVTKIKDGHLQAELTLRRHFAKVDIIFTPETYSITYNDSQMLRYDGHKIHRNYNKWIEFMADRIREQFTRL